MTDTPWSTPGEGREGDEPGQPPVPSPRWPARPAEGAPPPAYPPPSYPPPYAPSSYPPPYPGQGWEAPGQPGSGYGDGQGGYVLAGWWRRAGGFVVDALLFVVLTWIVLGATGEASTLTSAKATTAATGVLATAVVVEVIELLYVVAMIGWRGQTLGMMAAKVQLQDAKTGSTTIGFSKALIRGLTASVLGVAGYAIAVAAVLPLLNYLWPLWDRRNQTLHDKAAGTVAVTSPRAGRR